MGRLLGLALAVLATGCGPPRQYGGPIAIDRRGLTRRMEVLCRLGLGAPRLSPGPSPCRGPGLRPPSDDVRVGGEVPPNDHE
ncbi:MAG: hypothetical protein KC731_16445 [Myxococcales bacterium]|nr:hypothetical protein [Myxococcales bacterium]